MYCHKYLNNTPLNIYIFHFAVQFQIKLDITYCFEIISSKLSKDIMHTYSVLYN